MRQWFRASAQLWEEGVGGKEGGVNNIPRPVEWKEVQKSRRNT